MSLFIRVATFLSLAPSLITALAPQKPVLVSPIYSPYGSGPAPQNARANAKHIFNALHSSLRQWGSSVHHNGMSFFPVSVPTGSLFYHGTHSTERVTGFEWLAFEIEHAEFFTGDVNLNASNYSPPGGANGHGNKVVTSRSSSGSPTQNYGYLHTYQASRPLRRLLYVDGMSAAKTAMGTLDTQDLIIRNKHTEKRPGYDRQRGQELCEITREWGVEGIMRMEGGFEIIFCNFTDGLDLLHVDQRAPPDTLEGDRSRGLFEYIRGVSTRYHGVTGGRVHIDRSSMVSAFFYDVNLTNPDTTASKLPRLVSTNRNTLAHIRSDLQRMLEERYSLTAGEPEQGIDWQGVSDLVVTRYSTRLMFMAENSTTRFQFLGELNTLLNTFIDFGPAEIDIAASIERCQTHPLASVRPRTKTDHLLAVSVLTVAGKICTTLFDARDLILEEERKSMKEPAGSTQETLHRALQQARDRVQDLIQWLDWSIWKECGTCANNEVCLIPMWPFGTPDDYHKPSCKDSVNFTRATSYWDFD